jgi:uncharacterized membrane protein
MKNKLFMPILALITLSAIMTFWIKQLTKIEEFDIFGDIEDEEEL